MSFLKQVLGGAYYDATDLGKSPSFNDFSLHVGQDTTEVETAPYPESVRQQNREMSQKASPKKGYIPVGQSEDHYSEFVLGKNIYMKNLGTGLYDNVADPKKELSVWEQISKADPTDDAFKTSA
eukprot:TRINITY_DN3021_c0_g1_i11.p3 TRINITY_DN3021_c0_g1~~TRINITY_DN3021_c0_g1_i11.p3  ORF type:complete len:124 (+),score=28.06 TRINITY_DN3021_c0_g1_i11:107-478(+)